MGGPERKSASSSFGCGDTAWPAAGLTFLSSVPLRMAQKAARGQLLLHNWVQYLRCRGGTSGWVASGPLCCSVCISFWLCAPRCWARVPRDGGILPPPLMLIPPAPCCTTAGTSFLVPRLRWQWFALPWELHVALRAPSWRRWRMRGVAGGRRLHDFPRHVAWRADASFSEVNAPLCLCCWVDSLDLPSSCPLAHHSNLHLRGAQPGADAAAPSTRRDLTRCQPFNDVDKCLRRARPHCRSVRVTPRSPLRCCFSFANPAFAESI